MTSPERPNGRIEDIERARLQAEASDEAHTNAARARGRLSEQEPVIATNRDGIRFEIKSTEREANKKDVAYWDEEARRDELNAKPPRTVEEEIGRWAKN